MPANPHQDPRTVTVRILTAVIQNKRSLNDVLPAFLQQENQNNALIHELAAGSLRWWWRLSTYVDQLLSKPLKPKDFDVYCLLVIGVYQIQFMRIPDHAAVSQTVNSSREIGKHWSRNLINAVMRRFIREQDELEQKFKTNPVVIYSHPGWMIKQLQADWPDQWKTVLEASNKQPSLTLRINASKTTIDDVCQQLRDDEIEFSVMTDSPVGIVILDKSKIWHSALWKQGLVSVQDESAQLVACMPELRPGMRVLDACAAPGGKTCHLLEVEPDLNLLALEKDSSRMQRLEENLARLNLNAEARVADATDLDSWWNGEAFDLVLIDAPCSGSGVISKHPDIKHLRRPADIQQNIQNQRQLLDKLWSVLKTEGQLLYCTCSVFRQENDQQAQWFINKYTNAGVIALDGRFGLQMPYGRQRLPSESSDGFYYAGFTKNPH